jgi:hypothetical protein
MRKIIQSNENVENRLGIKNEGYPLVQTESRFIFLFRLRPELLDDCSQLDGAHDEIFESNFVVG